VPNPPLTMSRRFTLVTLALTAVVAFLVGAIFAGGGVRSSVAALPAKGPAHLAAKGAAPSANALLPNFADIVDRINPAVVNIDATTKGRDARGRRGRAGAEDPSVAPDGPNDPGSRFELDTPRRGEGSGFIIDADGSILTNNRVIDRAERIVVTLSDGRTARARVVGADPETDIALIKIDGQSGLPVAPLGDSTTLRMGEWVCAIGDPLGYDHSVTVGVVSFLGRKLFDASLDNYIQTDAAINFGNSGGPLINAQGRVIGINAAISARGSNIGFAVPINLASAILPQLRARGRVSRGYIGVALRGIDADLQDSLKLPVNHGAVIQDVTPDSPGERAGLRPYDIVVGLDDAAEDSDAQLIRDISALAPGSPAKLRVLRDGRQEEVVVKLAERPAPDREQAAPAAPAQSAAAGKPDADVTLGLTVRDLDRQTFDRLELPKATRGVLITRVEPLSSAFDGGISRGTVLLEINRQQVRSAADYRRITGALHTGDVLALYLYTPELDQRQLKTLHVEDR
jgi:serine protease Do